MKNYELELQTILACIKLYKKIINNFDYIYVNENNCVIKHIASFTLATRDFNDKDLEGNLYISMRRNYEDRRLYNLRFKLCKLYYLFPLVEKILTKEEKELINFFKIPEGPTKAAFLGAIQYKINSAKLDGENIIVDHSIYKLSNEHKEMLKSVNEK